MRGVDLATRSARGPFDGFAGGTPLRGIAAGTCRFGQPTRFTSPVAWRRQARRTCGQFVELVVSLNATASCSWRCGGGRQRGPSRGRAAERDHSARAIIHGRRRDGWGWPHRIRRRRDVSPRRLLVRPCQLLFRIRQPRRHLLVLGSQRLDPLLLIDNAGQQRLLIILATC